MIWLMVTATALVLVFWVRLVIIVRRARAVPSQVRVEQVRAALRAVGDGDEVLIAPGSYSSLSVEMIKEIAVAEGCEYRGDRAVLQRSTNRRMLVFIGATCSEDIV